MLDLAKRLLLAVALPVLLVSGAATAQLSLLEPTLRGLPEGDVELILAAESVFYAEVPPKPGSAESWLNDRNGDHGTVTLLEVYEWQGLPCRKIQHIVHVIGVRDMRSVTVNRCRVESGEWKIRS